MKFVRQQVSSLLSQCLESLPDKEVKQDYEVDTVLRLVLGHPPRPVGRKPYIGMFRNAELKFLRQQAAICISGRLVLLNDLPNATDTLVDALLRYLLGMPARTNEKLYFGIPLAQVVPPVTAEQLYQIAPHADPAQIDNILPHLNEAMKEYDINTRLRQAHFLAQILHESDNFNSLEEYDSGDAYEGRLDLGNTYPGDGPRFKGRGLLMITGRDNYKAVSKALGSDFINNPRWLSDEKHAAFSAAWFWHSRDLNELADQNDLDSITKIINGSWMGYKDRAKKLEAAKKIFHLF